MKMMNLLMNLSMQMVYSKKLNNIDVDELDGFYEHLVEKGYDS